MLIGQVGKSALCKCYRLHPSETLRQVPQDVSTTVPVEHQVSPGVGLCKQEFRSLKTYMLSCLHRGILSANDTLG